MQSANEIIKRSPLRKCLVTGSNVEKKHLIRFVVDPEKNLIVDVDQSLPGRGYWVKAERNIIKNAINKNILLKAVKQNVNIDVNLLPNMEMQIKRKIISQISLARKAGKAIFGFDKIKKSLLGKSINLLIQANDGSEKEKQRLITKSVNTIIGNCLTGSELGKAFGRERVIHCAILENGFVEKIIFNADRLNNLKNPVPHYSNIKVFHKT